MKTKGAIVNINGNIPVRWDGRVVKCEFCKAWIGWGITRFENKIPFDHGDENCTSHFDTCKEYYQYKRGQQ